VKASDGLDEVAEGAAKPVEAPDNENVTWSKLGDGLLQAVAIRSGRGLDP
jgi:hypothetical protein